MQGKGINNSMLSSRGKPDEKESSTSSKKQESQDFLFSYYF